MESVVSPYLFSRQSMPVCWSCHFSERQTAQPSQAFLEDLTSFIRFLIMADQWPCSSADEYKSARCMITLSLGNLSKRHSKPLIHLLSSGWDLSDFMQTSDFPPILFLDIFLPASEAALLGAFQGEYDLPLAETSFVNRNLKSV